MASNYPAGFYFKLSFKGEDAAFQAASGMSKEFGIEEVTCGGENRFKYRLPTVVTSQNLVLKRALVTKNSSLVNWCTAWLDQGFANNVTAQSVWLSLLNADSSTLKMWAFHNVYPVKYSISDLNSQESTLVIESIELAYTYFEIQ